MFIPVDQITSIIKDAHDDLLAFLVDFYKEGSLKQEWSNAETEMAEIEKTPNMPRSAGFGEFIDRFLPWLEDRRGDPLRPPWMIVEKPGKRREKEVCLPMTSECLRFLKSLADNLDSLLEPSEEYGIKLRLCGGRPSSLLQSFAMFTARQQNCILSYNDIRFDWDKHPGFASWLIVYANGEEEEPVQEKDAVQGELHVVSNEKRIARSSKEVDIQTRRFERAFLHELGHARTKLERYLERHAVNGVVYSLPEDETHAWVYVCGLEACIAGARARMNRLLRRGDGEWR